MPQGIQKSQHDEGSLLPGLRKKLQLSSMRLRVQEKVLTEETPLLETFSALKLIGGDFFSGLDFRFQCPDCPKNYKHLHHLKSHLKYECNKKPQFECPVCTKRFHYQFMLNSHVKQTSCRLKLGVFCQTFMPQ